MSAIAAIFNLDGAPADEGRLRRMTEVVAHRGPDGIGAWTSGAVGLSTCLLKTTPEAADEDLPLVAGGGRYAVAFDGRIDNRDELATALEIEAGDMPDSALLLAAYRCWNEGCVDRIAGDFAFVIWDSQRNQLFCARDPLGIRLLHYYSDGKRFIAATEVSQILAVVDADVDLVSLSMYLHEQKVPADRTFLRGINKLPGGCRMTVSAAGERVETYWNPDPSDLLRLKDFREYEERFLEHFKDSVRSRMRTDQPVAVSLSGGMDSTSILAIAEHMRREQDAGLPEVRYYSNVYAGMDEVDESDYIRATVEMYGPPGTMIESGEFDDSKAGSSPLGLKRAEPYIAPHEESQRRLFAEVQGDGLHTLLTGLIGDEAFSVGAGFLSDTVRRFDLRGVRREWRYFTKSAWLTAGMVAAASLVPFGLHAGNEKPAAWLSKQAAEAVRSTVDSPLTAERKFRSLHFRDVESWIQVRGGLAGYTWADVTTAEYGIAPSHPFADRRLVEFLVSVPPDVKFRHGYTKRVLRRAMKGILPEVVRNRRYKTDFSSLYDRKTTQVEVDAVSGFIESPVLADLGLVEPKALKKAWERYRQAGTNADNQERTAVWAVVTLEQWLRERSADRAA